MVIARLMFVMRSQQISCDIRNFVRRGKNSSFFQLFFPINVNVLNNKTIILLSRAEYRLILANPAYGLVKCQQEIPGGIPTPLRLRDYRKNEYLAEKRSFEGKYEILRTISQQRTLLANIPASQCRSQEKKSNHFIATASRKQAVFGLLKKKFQPSKTECAKSG